MAARARGPGRTGSAAKGKKRKKAPKAAKALKFAPENQDFLGMVGNELQIAVAQNANLAYLAQQYRRAGVGHVRVALNWDSIEREPDGFEWGYEDLRVSAIANAGLRTLGILGRTPQWASSCPASPLSYQCIAANLDDYRSYVRRSVQRYGPAGTGQIRDWEIRIESNPVGDDPEAYGVEDYVVEANAAFEVIKEEDPGALVWVGEYAFGRFNLDQALKWSIYVAENAKFDIHSIHHFNSPAQVLTFTKKVRQELDSRGLGHKPLAVTAMNVFVANQDEYTEEMQAANLRSVYVNAWKGGAEYAMWFAGTQWPDLADRRYGIFRYDAAVPDGVVPRLAYEALRGLGAQLPAPPPGAMPYGCMGVSANPATPVGGVAHVALHFYSTGLALPHVQVRDGDALVVCDSSNRAGLVEISVPQGTSRTLTLFAAPNCAAGPLTTGPLARVRVEALP